MGDLTANLSRHEFACKCGCGFDTLDIETAWVIQDVCDHFQTTVLITSGCRCEVHNKKVGGAEMSKHLEGRAGDCKFAKVTPEGVHDYLIKKYKDRFGFGCYPTFNHIDTRSGAPWRQDPK